MPGWTSDLRHVRLAGQQPGGAVPVPVDAACDSGLPATLAGDSGVLAPQQPGLVISACGWPASADWTGYESLRRQGQCRPVQALRVPQAQCKALQAHCRFTVGSVQWLSAVTASTALQRGGGLGWPQGAAGVATAQCEAYCLRPLCHCCVLQATVQAAVQECRARPPQHRLAGGPAESRSDLAR